MEFIIHLLRQFVYITTGILFVFIVIMLIDGSDSISFQTLAEIPCAAFVTALVTTIVYLREIKKKKDFYIRIALHYLLLCVIMVIFGTTVGWINLNPAGIMTMVISTAAIYVFTFAGTYLSSKCEAKKLNMALQSKRKKRR